MDQGQTYVTAFISFYGSVHKRFHSWEWEKCPMVSYSFDSHVLWKAKGFFSSNLIRRLQVDSRTRKIPHCFFNFRDTSTQTCENFLQSIFIQLIYSLPDIPDAISELYSRHNSGTLRPSVRDTTDCFIAVVNTLDEVRLFGDAFDECAYGLERPLVLPLYHCEEPVLKAPFAIHGSPRGAYSGSC
jgi:hypothetical protein